MEQFRSAHAHVCTGYLETYFEGGERQGQYYPKPSDSDSDVDTQERKNKRMVQLAEVVYDNVSGLTGYGMVLKVTTPTSHPLLTGHGIFTHILLFVTCFELCIYSPYMCIVYFLDSLSIFFMFKATNQWHIYPSIHLSIQGLKYAYYGKELINLLVNADVLQTLGPIMEALKEFHISGPNGLLAVYYLACNNDLKRWENDDVT